MTRDEFLRGGPAPRPRAGYQLLYHVTRPENAQSIVQEGLSTARAVNEGERGWIWASQEPDAFYGTDAGTLIVLQVPARGTAADLDPYNGVTWDVGSSVVILRDVPPEDIVAVDPEIRTGLGTRRLSFFRDGEYAPIYWDEWFGPEVARRTRSNPCRSNGTRSAAFKRWFGASKIVDDLGRPLVVYHGTQSDFDAFDPSQGIGGGNWFTTQEIAARYAYGSGARLVPVYLKMDRPLRLAWPKAEPGAAARKARQSRSHDGLIYLGEDGSTSYVVFEPTQIKSVNNVGTWSPTDPRMRHNPRRRTPTTDYARLQPDDILRVYHGTHLNYLPSLINGFDATAEHPRHYGGPRHAGLFVAPTEESASQFGPEVVLEIEVQARFLHGTDYSGNIGRASDAHPERMSKAWVTAKYPASFRPLLSESLQQRGEPQALLKGLVGPNAIKRVRYRGKWYSRADFLSLGLTTSTPENPYAEHALTDAGFDFSNPRYSLPVLFAHIARLLDATPERIEDAFFLRARSRGAQAVQDLLDNLFIRGQAQDVYTRRIMQTAGVERPIL